MKTTGALALVLSGCLGLLVLASQGSPAPQAPDSRLSLPRATPESQGVSSADLLAFVNALDRIEQMHSVMVVRHGRVIAEGWWTPYDAQSRHELFSLSKSFTSTAIGFAVQEGLVHVDDEVLKYFPKAAPPEPSQNLKAMRVRDLLTMTAGHQDESAVARDQISPTRFLAHPVPHKPGTHFRYNTPATFMLAALLEARTGTPLLDYLKPRLFEPLGIQEPTWDKSFEGIALGGYGLSVRTEDIAKFGQLYLQKGSWKGRSLLAPSWVELATGRQVSNGSNPKSDWDQGYGFQFWRCRNGAYRGDGAFGQYCVVFPDHDAVLAITSAVKDMQAVLNVVWEQLLPAFHPRRLPSNTAARKSLETRLSQLTVPVAQGTSTSASRATVLGAKYQFPENDMKLEAFSLQANPSGSGWILNTRVAGVDSQIPCGDRSWINSRGTFFHYRPNEPLAASGGWVDDSTFVARVCARETPYLATLRLRFEGDQVSRDWSLNVSFGPATIPTVRGNRVP